MALYSEMTPDELTAEMAQLQAQGQKAHDTEQWSEYEVLMNKWYLAKSYLIQSEFHLEIGRTYALTEEYDRITATKQEGVMAWGIKESTGEEIAVPIAMLATEQ